MSFSTQSSSTKNRPGLLFILGTIAFLALAIGIIILTIIDGHKTAKLKILIAPSFATVEIDQHKFSTDTTTKFFPGSYTVNISADGFVSQSLPLDLPTGQETHLYIALEPTPENANFYQNNTAEADLRQAVYDATYQLGSDEFLARYPVACILPYDHYTQNEFFEPTGYRIDYGHFDNCKNSFCLQVTGYTQSALSEAKSYLQSKGFNPNDYEIVFNYTPLDKPSPEDFPPEIRKALEAAGYFD